MSRIGKQPIPITQRVEVKLEGQTIKVKGPKGELVREIHPRIKVEIKEEEISVVRMSESKTDRSLHGLFRTLISNMVEGVTKGFEKKLQIVGVGYKAQANGSNKIKLNLGFSHPIDYEGPEGISFEQDKDNKNTVLVKGISKELVGQAAADIRSFRPPEPYKGKGIKYENERIIRKAGKAAASAK